MACFQFLWIRTVTDLQFVINKVTRNTLFHLTLCNDKWMMNLRLHVYVLVYVCDMCFASVFASHPPRLNKMFHDVTPNWVCLQQMPAPDKSTNYKHCQPPAQLTTYLVYVRSIPLWNSLTQEAVTLSTESHKDVDIAQCYIQPALCMTAADDVSSERWISVHILDLLIYFFCTLKPGLTQWILFVWSYDVML